MSQVPILQVLIQGQISSLGFRMLIKIRACVAMHNHVAKKKYQISYFFLVYFKKKIGTNKRRDIANIHKLTQFLIFKIFFLIMPLPLSTPIKVLYSILVNLLG